VVTLLGRCFVSNKPGAPEIDRTRGISDKRKGSKSKTNANKKRRAVILHEPSSSKRHRKNTDERQGYEKDDAQRHLKKFGAKEGWILECYTPDNLLTGDRWFMRVENGLTMKDAEGNTLIKTCQWMKTK
jgi:hypothetical protein